MPHDASPPHDHAASRPSQGAVPYTPSRPAPDAVLDSLVQLAARLCGVALGLVTVMDGPRQVFRARTGFGGPPDASLDYGFCPIVAERGVPLVIPDTQADPAYADNPIVRDHGVRFYAGVPLRTSEGQAFGTLCVLDRAPRPRGLSPMQLDVLLSFATQVTGRLALLDSLLRRDALLADVRRRQAMLDSAVDFAIVATDPGGRITDWNAGAEHILGWTAADMLGEPLDRIFVPEDVQAGRPAAEMRLATAHGREADERWHQRRGGARFWASGELMVLRDGAGGPIGFLKILRDRTAQHEAGKALREAEAALQRAQVAGGIGAFSIEIADNVLKATPEFCRLFGVPEKERMAPGEIEALLLPEDAALASRVRPRQDATAALDVEYRIRRADTGAVRWIARRAEFERDEAGRPLRFIGVVRDITEQRAALDALAQSKDRYRALFEAIDDGFCIIEFFDGPHGPASDYVHIEANPGYERHTGIADIVGRTLRDLAPDEADGWVALYGGVLRTGQAIRFEREFVAAGRDIEVSAARLEPASRRQVSVLFRDVTARRRAEAALRDSEAVAQENVQRVQLALAAGAIIGTWLWDLPTDRFTVDRGFALAFGLDPALGRVGLSLEQVVATVHPDDKPGLAAAIREAIGRGGAYAHQYRVRRADGRFYWIEANGRVDLGPDGTPLSFPGVLIDVEARRAVEAERDRAAAALRALNETLEQRVAARTAELMHAEEQLRQSQKMEAVGQLTGGLAHDFNNLLTGVTGSLELLQTRIAQGRVKEVDRYIAAAQGAARRAASLTHRLLAFSRRQTLDPKPTDVDRLVHGMEELIRRTVGPEITVEPVLAGPGLWATLVDPGQLENALLNLCINARDAMPHGGRIAIETANRRLDGHEAREHDLPPGDYMSMSVSDTGSGMTPEVIAKAFDPFFTTKPIGMGTGLGLSMIYGFAKQSGGQVRIQSSPGRGTTVHVVLPRHAGTEAVPEPVDRPGGAPRAEDGQAVLVVDDEPTVRMLVGEVLQDLGYTAIEAADGAAGLAILRSSVRIDLLVTDVGLPGGMNGRQVADAARVVRPGLKVLFITGYAETAVLSHGHLDPGMHVMTKPFAMEALAGRIKELISG